MGVQGRTGSVSPKRIFLSYGHDEFTPLALQIKMDLEAAGHEVWFDLDRIIAGQDWEAYIEKGLDWVSEKPFEGRFVLLMTPYSVRRPNGFCLNEITAALNRRIPIIPIMVSICEPPLSICRLQWLDMQDCWPVEKRPERYRARLESLLDVLGQNGAVDGVELGGAQSQLIHILEPLSFHADISQYIKKFMGRQWVFDRIESWLADSDASRIFLITGPPGIGKTAIASWLSYNFREVAAFHLCRYGNSQKSDARRCVLSIAYQLSTQLLEYKNRLLGLNLGMEIKDYDAKTLFDHLVVQPLSDRYPGPDHTVLIVIDALDEAGQGDKNEIADFIAEEFMKTPEWMRLVVTTRPDSGVMYSLQEQEPYILDAQAPENIDDIRAYLARELKLFTGNPGQLDTAIETILAKSEGIFLYVEWIRKELLAGRLALGDLEAFPQGLGGVYAQFFRRQFPDVIEYGKKVRPALEVISAAREPLKAEFIVSILKWNEYEREEIYRSLGSLFFIIDGRVKPFHGTLLDWLTDNRRAGPYFVSEAGGHRILSERCFGEFRRGPEKWSPYLLTYLPMHLCMSGRLEELETVLGDISFIRTQWDRDPFNVMKEWTFTEQHSRLRMVDLYKKVIEQPGDIDDGELRLIASVMKGTYHLCEAFKAWDHLADHYRRADNLSGLKEALINQASILYYRGELDGSMIGYKEHEHICRETDDIRGIALSLGYQAEILRSRSDYGNALILLKEVERIFRELGDRSGLQRNLGDQGQILRVRGEFDTATALLVEQERICRELGNKSSLVHSLYNQAVICRMRGDLERSMALLKEMEKICREIGDKAFLVDAVGDKGILLLMRGDLAGAMALFNEEERIAKEIDNKYHLARSFGNQAAVLRLRGDLAGATKLLLAGEDIYRSFGTRYGLSISLYNRAIVLRMMGDTAGAIDLHQESERLSREIGYRYGLQKSLRHHAAALLALGKPLEAMTLLREQEKICEEMKLKQDMEKCRVAQKAVLIALKGTESKAPALTK